MPQQIAWQDEFRATLIHPDDRVERTPRGRVRVSPGSNYVYVDMNVAPDWITDDGVEVVVGNEDGDVVVAFTVTTTGRDKNAIVLRP